MNKKHEETSDKERAVLVFVNSEQEDDAYVEDELTELAFSAGLEVVDTFRQRRSRPDRVTYLGKGKAEEIFVQLQDIQTDVAIIDAELSPAQQRNLADQWKIRVIDRTQLILDIFAQRAHTNDGMLQVELAQLNYLLPRVTSVYTQFERQKGGIGLRGPGETKLEADRRTIKQRISHLSKELDELIQQRHLQRIARRRKPFPFGAIVGYTSAGKSTLLNTLAGSNVYTDAKLFSTLDPTTRRVVLPDGYSVFLTDTVGFIRELPHALVAAFKATLEEVTEADFILHVVDISNPKWETHIDVVLELLTELQAINKPRVTVFNKSDLAEDHHMIRELVASTPDSVMISAKKSLGLNDFMEIMNKVVRSVLFPIIALVPYSESVLVSDCYEYGRLHKADYREEGIYIEGEVVEEISNRLTRYFVNKDESVD